MRAVLVPLLLAVGPYASALKYTVVDLGVFRGMNDSVAYGLNDDELVVGRSNSGAGWPFASTQPTGLVRLGPMLAMLDQGEARGVNGSGTVCGWVFWRFGGVLTTYTPCTWTRAGGIRILPFPDGYHTGLPQRINANGQCAGYSLGDQQQAVFWPASGSAVIIPKFDPRYGAEAFSVNNLSEVVGAAGLPRDGFHYDVHAFLWRSGELMHDLGVMPGFDQSWAQGANDSGAVVGYCSSNATFQDRSFIRLAGGPMQDLGQVAGQDDNRAWAVNGKGEATGESYGFNTVNMFLYEPGLGMLLVQDLLDDGSAGWDLNAGYDINDHGDIAGAATHDGQRRAVLLLRTD